MNEVIRRNRDYWASTATQKTVPFESSLPHMKDLPEIGAWPDDDWMDWLDQANARATMWRRTALAAVVLACVGWLV